MIKIVLFQLHLIYGETIMLQGIILILPLCTQLDLAVMMKLHYQ